MNAEAEGHQRAKATLHRIIDEVIDDLGHYDEAEVARRLEGAIVEIDADLQFLRVLQRWAEP